MLHHLSLGSRDIERAVRFYDAVLAPLGIVRVWSDLRPGARGQAVGYGPPGAGDALAIKQVDEPVPNVPGFHVALTAPSQAAVAAFHAAALSAGGRDNGPPGLRHHYGADYFAAFVIDPEGHRLEAVCRGAEPAPRPDATDPQPSAAAVAAPAAPRAGDPLPLDRRGARLRRLRPGDLPAFLACRGDAELARFQGWSAMTEEEGARFIAEMADAVLFTPGEWVQIAIADPASDRLLGDVGLHLAADGTSAEIGFTLAREAQGRGVATAAVEAALELLFARTAIARVVAVTDARNAPSIALLGRVGLQHVESREAVFKGEECTEWVFAMAR
ncbi:MAG: GNAT family N-acetyltransferase [Rubrivivax sp.]|jgi:RimJ/RimL family protein N-acetyltransferase/catechol 2,3-dioxygenase-like lactoylglutathione lyase family enzyme|nr:GNAT family N-acetyltransferase [Rubrivivax sp.]